VELLVRHGAEALAESEDPAALVGAAGAGDTDAVERLLALGISIDTRGADGETALHAAAFAGRASTVRLLVERGAELEARDTTWQSTPLGWAREGRSSRPQDETGADWDETVRVLIDAGAGPELE
jgi:ankyrin repeat protein